MNEITVKPIDTSKAEEYRTEAERVLINSKELIIKNQTDYEQALSLTRVIRQKLKDLTETRLSITKPLDQAKKAVMALFERPTKMLEEAKECADKAVITYTDLQEQKRKEQELKLQAEAEKKRKELEAKAEAARVAGKDIKAEQYEVKAQAVIAPTLAERIQKVDGVSYRDQWSAVVIDVNAVPREYMMPNMVMLNKIAQATKGSLPIAGVVMRCEKILSQRR